MTTPFAVLALLVAIVVTPCHLPAYFVSQSRPLNRAREPRRYEFFRSNIAAVGLRLNGERSPSPGETCGLAVVGCLTLATTEWVAGSSGRA